MINYNPFRKYVLRTPAMAVHESVKKKSEQEILEAFLDDSYFLESIFMASSVLYEELMRYRAGKLPQKEEKHLTLSLLKYATRMMWRCTPFGLFSGCSVGQLGDQTDIVLPVPQEYNRYIRLDMNYLCALIQHIEKQETIRALLKYFPNNSCYPVSNQLRYVEYHYRNANRKHNLVLVDNSAYLQKLLESANKTGGKTIKELAECIKDEEISLEEASEFIVELIDNQLLISELEPSVTGKDVLDKFIEQLQIIDNTLPVVQQLVDIQSFLKEINSSPIGSTLALYEQIIDIIKSIGVKFEAKYLFQTDMIKVPVKATLPETVPAAVWEAVTFLNKLTLFYGNPNLNDFKTAFYNRYESMEMPLLQVLDNEMGIGYPVNRQGDVAPLLEKYVLPNPDMGQNQSVNWSPVQAVLHQKYLEAYAQKQYEIKLSETDFKLQEAQWNDVPNTLAAMCRIFIDKEQNPLIYLSSCGGSGAGNLLARFAHADPDMEDFVQQITQKETELQEDAILAEIVHLPESRIGNILFRPVIRPYEIPYLAKSAVDFAHQIPLSDLFVSLKNNRILLRSKRLNKNIIPRLTTAHNFSMNAMPVYRFLCDLQTAQQRAAFGLKWSNLTDSYAFLPRVSYKNVILSLARWTIKTDELKKMFENEAMVKTEHAPSLLQKWRSETLMPRYVVLPDGDNELFVDMDNLWSITLLLDVVKKRPQFYLEEFPHNMDNLLVSDIQGNKYVNECIFGFYKTIQS
ncbi:MAG: lantibiotic dehydratase family protein [Bacteroidales bacterium]|nr:lantibiotic dehydratase family protein [Bacteroidales bacterium]